MKRYQFIDADAHVEECDDTWNYLDEEFRPRRPVAVTLDRAPSRGNLNAEASKRKLLVDNALRFYHLS